MKNNIINFSPAMVVNQATVAQLTGKSIPTIKSWERQGKLHATIVNGSKLFDLDEVVALIRPNNKHSRKTYLIADIPEYNNFISQIAKDVAKELAANGTFTTI